MSFLTKTQDKKREMEKEEKLKVIDEELLTFCDYCDRVGFTESEMKIICAPLKAFIRKNNLKKHFMTLLKVTVFLLGVYGGLQLEGPKVHVCAMGRLALIELLPFWDWTSIFYESCLVSNPFFKGHSVKKEDCLSCETIENIERISDVTFETLLNGYLVRDTPVVVSDAMNTWPVMNTDQFYFENITEAYLNDERLMDTVPCAVISNIRAASFDLQAFLKYIEQPNVDNWFAHWQNCDIKAVKALRKFYQRPYFLSTAVAPAHFNWVFMSSNYNTSVYKEVELDTGLIMLAQLRGTNSFRLIAQSPCNRSCSVLLGDLREGEMLVFTNYMWKLEYHPGKNTDNLAILTETVWGDNAI